MSNLTTSTSGNVTLILNPTLCTLDTCDLSLASFSYVPNLAGNALFLAIFAVLLVPQLGLGIRYRTWGFMTALCMGLILEVVGYVGRVMINQNPFNNNAFLIYLICVTIAPAFFTAGIYLCLSRIVTAYGADFSRFKPRTVFGGGIASTANDVNGKNLGKNIMIAGLIVQVISLFLFAACCLEFGVRVHQNKGAWNPKFINLVNSRLFKGFLFALGTAVITITIRSIFRCAELSGGFNGPLFNEEIPFMILEGPMVIIAVTALTALHPAVSFQGCWHEAGFVFWKKFTFRNKTSQASYKLESDSGNDESQRYQGGNMELHEIKDEDARARTPLDIRGPWPAR